MGQSPLALTVMNRDRSALLREGVALSFEILWSLVRTGASRLQARLCRPLRAELYRWKPKVVNWIICNFKLYAKQIEAKILYNDRRPIIPKSAPAYREAATAKRAGRLGRRKDRGWIKAHQGYSVTLR